MRFALILAIALGSPLVALAQPQATPAPPTHPQGARQPPDPALEAAKRETDIWRREAVTYRQWFHDQSDALAQAMALCGAPCQPPPPQQHQ